RRHTRSKRDWSSDVCSSDLWTDCGSRDFWLTIRPSNSDLPLSPESDLAAPAAPSISRRLRSWSALISLLLKQTVDWLTSGAPARSEERRVGKECRTGWRAWA